MINLKNKKASYSSFWLFLCYYPFYFSLNAVAKSSNFLPCSIAVSVSSVPVIIRLNSLIDCSIDNSLIVVARSEEHTSELQSRDNLVCRLLLEKKKITNNEL